MNTKKRLIIYLSVLLWLAFIATTMNVLGWKNLIEDETGQRILAYQYIPLQIAIAFLILRKSKFVNIVSGIVISIFCFFLFALIKTPTSTPTGDTVIGVIFIVVVNWIIISLVWEIIFLSRSYFSTRANRR